MPPDPLESFKLLLNCLNSTLLEKTLLEKVTKFDTPSLKKFSKYAPDMKHFKKAYLRPFLGLNVRTSLCLANIQPNSKLHPPPSKLSGSAPGDKYSFRKDKKLMGHRTFVQQKWATKEKRLRTTGLVTALINPKLQNCFE